MLINIDLHRNSGKIPLISPSGAALVYDNIIPEKSIGRMMNFAKYFAYLD